MFRQRRRSSTTMLQRQWRQISSDIKHLFSKRMFPHDNSAVLFLSAGSCSAAFYQEARWFSLIHIHITWFRTSRPIGEENPCWSIFVYKLLFGFTVLRADHYLCLSERSVTRGHPYKLLLSRCSTSVRKHERLALRHWFYEYWHIRSTLARFNLLVYCDQD